MTFKDREQEMVVVVGELQLHISLDNRFLGDQDILPTHWQRRTNGCLSDIQTDPGLKSLLSLGSYICRKKNDWTKMSYGLEATTK